MSEETELERLIPQVIIDIPGNMDQHTSSGQEDTNLDNTPDRRSINQHTSPGLAETNLSHTPVDHNTNQSTSPEQSDKILDHTPDHRNMHQHLGDLKREVEILKRTIVELHNQTKSIEQLQTQTLDRTERILSQIDNTPCFPEHVAAEFLPLLQENYMTDSRRNSVAGRLADKYDVKTLVQGGKDEIIHMLPHVLLYKNKEEIVELLQAYKEKGGTLSGIVDKDNNTLLHFAVGKEYLLVVDMLLSMEGIDLLAKDKDGKTALQIALENEFDAIGASIVKHMKQESVMDLFKRQLMNRNEPPQLNLYDYVSIKYQETVLAILDTMITERGNTSVTFEILEADKEGIVPDKKKYKGMLKANNKSVFQKFAEIGNQRIVNHPVVRLLIYEKWKAFARQQFVIYAVMYLVSLFVLTIVAVMSVTAENVVTYNSPLQYVRACFEMVFYVWAVIIFVKELSELKRWWFKDYFRDVYNIAEIVSSFLVVVILPMRYVHVRTSWYMFSFAYFFWACSVFKYMVVFKKSGTYAQILWRIVVEDIFKFSLMFVVIIHAFGGTFMLALKADGFLGDIKGHNETSSFWLILFFGLRSMVEGEKIVEYTDYTNDSGSPWSTIIFIAFLFVTIVVMLNILIAQLSNTYQKIQDEVLENWSVNRARLISRIEQNDCHYYFKCMFKEPNRVKHYKPYVGYTDESLSKMKLKNDIAKVLNKTVRS